MSVVRSVAGTVASIPQFEVPGLLEACSLSVVFGVGMNSIPIFYVKNLFISRNHTNVNCKWKSSERFLSILELVVILVVMCGIEWNF